MLNKILHFTLTAKEKAMVGGLVAAVGAFLNQNGLNAHDLTSVHVLQALLVFLVTHQAVYWTANSGK